MKRFVDLQRIERIFYVKDLVFLCLQLYRQQSMVQSQNLKLSTRFFKPFKVMERIVSVVYQLDHPPNTLVHPVFHVLCLKKKPGHKDELSSTVPSCDEDEAFKAKPEEILQRQMQKKGH